MKPTDHGTEGVDPRGSAVVTRNGGFHPHYGEKVDRGRAFLEAVRQDRFPEVEDLGKRTGLWEG